jgi:poly(3-hydroxybutyrate) depolymerase
MKIKSLITILVCPLLIFGQLLYDTSSINITKTWDQQPGGYSYPISIYIPNTNSPENGFPVCILLHGNGGNGNGINTQFQNILNCHILIAPTGYLNSWNLCAEDSDAPDIEMINELINHLQTFSNINSNEIRILGFSNGAGLANRAFIENNNEGVDIVCSIVSQLNEPQFHDSSFYLPNEITDPNDPYCGYNQETNPLAGRKYLNISNDNDQVIPYYGGSSVVGMNFLAADQAIFHVAQSQGYIGDQITGNGTPFGTPLAFEYSYLDGRVVNIRSNAGHGLNLAEEEYISSFFSNCSSISSENEIIKTKISVYPNPFKSSISIKNSNEKVKSFQISDVLSKINIIGLLNPATTTLDLSSLPSGIYFLKTEQEIIKLIKD